MMENGPEWQRLDIFLWHARVMRQRADCTALAAGRLLRINRQSIHKAHAKVRIGDILTVPMVDGRQVIVMEVLALAARRGPAAEATRLYRLIAEPGRS